MKRYGFDDEGLRHVAERMGMSICGSIIERETDAAKGVGPLCPACKITLRAAGKAQP